METVKIIKIEGSIYNEIMNKGQAGAGRIVAFPQNHKHISHHLPFAANNHETWTVCGDSLNTNDPSTTICDGDLVVTKTKFEREDVIGRLCVLRLLNSENVIKRVFYDGANHVRLESNRPGDPPEYVEAAEVEVLGVVKFFIRAA